VKAGAAIVFNKVSFRYPGGLQIFDKFSLRLNAGQRVGLLGSPAAGNPLCLSCCRDFTT
jgi:ATP-binding cassette subfamily B protein